MTIEELNLLDSIRTIRAENNKLWMDLLWIAMSSCPKETKRVLSFISKNDLKITELTRKLSEGE